MVVVGAHIDLGRDAVVAVSHKCLATSHLPVLLFDAPNVKPKNRI
jgi:hypothetical protein